MASHPRKKNNIESIELHFGNRASCEKAFTSPIIANGVSILAHPVVSSEDKLLRLNVNQLPPLPYHVLAAGLLECLPPFGVVQEIVVDEDNLFYRGSGHIYMTRTPNSEKLLKTLSHRVTYDSRHEFLATWLRMGARCKYCKAMGHDVANCPRHS
ncbi:hypothetical protein BDF14DRAFT_1745468 [Spinellus fusiger]|nr:hypothetical protein BDF14DRAFT_1745468 [Spinellus fusiger]